MNTRINITETPIDETQKVPRQSKYSKDDTNKYLYPCLDEKDSGRHMTDKQLVESVKNLSEACITEKQK